MNRSEKYKEAYLIGVAIPNSHNLHNSITEKLQKYTDFKVELIRIWQLRMAYKIPLVLSTTGIIPNKLHKRLKLLNLYLSVYILMQNILYMPYSHKVFGRTVNEKSLVSEIHTPLNQLNLCEIRSVVNGNSNK